MNVMVDGNKILACVDQSGFADFVTDYASWAALRTGAPLELLHILDRAEDPNAVQDLSGAIGMDARETLLDQLSSKDETFKRTARELGRVFLNRLREQAEKAGVQSPDVRQRHGELVETLVEQQSDTRLIVLGRRGASAETTQRDLGRNVERVVRALKCPILTVTEHFKTPERVVLAFDGTAITRQGVDLIAQSPLFQGLAIHLLMSGKPRPDGERKLKAAQERLELAGFDVTSVFLPGDPEAVIARYIADQQMDMLVMGAYTHSPIRNLIFGSKTSDLLRSARVPTLLLRKG